MSRKVPSVTVSAQSAATVATTSVIPLDRITSAVASVAVKSRNAAARYSVVRNRRPPLPLFWQRLIPVAKVRVTRAPVPRLFDRTPAKFTLMK